MRIEQVEEIRSRATVAEIGDQVAEEIDGGSLEKTLDKPMEYIYTYRSMEDYQRRKENDEKDDH